MVSKVQEPVKPQAWPAFTADRCDKEEPESQLGAVRLLRVGEPEPMLCTLPIDAHIGAVLAVEAAAVELPDCVVNGQGSWAGVLARSDEAGVASYSSDNRDTQCV